MTKPPRHVSVPVNRRRVLAGLGAFGWGSLLAGAGWALPRVAIAADAPVKLGLLLPYSGTYALLGEAITQGLMLRLAEAGDRVAGRRIEIIAVDSEAAAARAPVLTRRLVSHDKVDFLIGPVHSGVAQAMVTALATLDSPILIVPNAGSNLLTRGLCRPTVFRSSFSNWQAAWPAGKIMAMEGHKTAVTLTWNYAAGTQMMAAGAESFTAAGGKILKNLTLPFPDVDFRAAIREIAATGPDAVFAFFSGGGAIRFVQDFHAAGLRDQIGLYGPGFLTEGVTQAQGEAAEGLRTTLHYGDGLDFEADRRFRQAYRAHSGKEANVFAVQGYDTGTLVIRALEAAGGDPAQQELMINALENAHLPDSPRGPWRMSKAHNPVQDFYLREVVDGRNVIVGIAEPALADPASGCKRV